MGNSIPLSFLFAIHRLIRYFFFFLFLSNSSFFHIIRVCSLLLRLFSVSIRFVFGWYGIGCTIYCVSSRIYYYYYSRHRQHHQHLLHLPLSNFHRVCVLRSSVVSRRTHICNIHIVYSRHRHHDRFLLCFWCIVSYVLRSRWQRE